MMRVILIGTIVLLSVATMLKIRPLLSNFETVPIHFDLARSVASAGQRFDRVLLEHLDSLSYIRSLDSALRAGSDTYTIKQPLWMDRCEVRQGDFYKFLGWQPFHPEQTISAPNTPPHWQYTSSNQEHSISGRLDAPANGVTWYDAYAYCHSVGGRLPRRQEWTSAAMGSEERLYPWGDVFDPTPSPYLDPVLNAAQQCGVYPDTDTPTGIADLGQHVSEWASDETSSTQVPIMGGNAYNAPATLYGLATLYRFAPPTYRSTYLGFRCVYDAPPKVTPWRTVPVVVPIAPGVYPLGIPKESVVASLVTHLAPGRLDVIGEMFQHDKATSPQTLYVTKGEITRRRYAVFLNDPFVRTGLYADRNQPAKHDYKPPDWAKQITAPDLPVVNVDWWSAYAFASWAGGRLPSAEEWSFIASGGGKRLYPWGNRFDAGAPISAERRLGMPLSVETREDFSDQTPDGIKHLAGNVSEWTRSVSGVDGAYTVVIKGGNYLLPGIKTGRMDFSNYVSPHYRSKTLGFRVVFEQSR